jgi:hypothetical protein
LSVEENRFRLTVPTESDQTVQTMAEIRPMNQAGQDDLILNRIEHRFNRTKQFAETLR